MSPPAEPRGWEASYDPLHEPELLFVRGSIAPAEPAEPAAARVRVEVDAVLEEPLGDTEIAATRERFGLLLGIDALAPRRCAQDARGLAVARARQAQLGVDAPASNQALGAVTEAQLREAAALFAPTRTAAVIAGGMIR
jgi:hypothetical protein